MSKKKKNKNRNSNTSGQQSSQPAQKQQATQDPAEVARKAVATKESALLKVLNEIVDKMTSSAGKGKEVKEDAEVKGAIAALKGSLQSFVPGDEDSVEEYCTALADALNGYIKRRGIQALADVISTYANGEGKKLTNGEASKSLAGLKTVKFLSSDKDRLCQLALSLYDAQCILDNYEDSEDDADDEEAETVEASGATDSGNAFEALYSGFLDALIAGVEKLLSGLPTSAYRDVLESPEVLKKTVTFGVELRAAKSVDEIRDVMEGLRNSIWMAARNRRAKQMEGFAEADMRRVFDNGVADKARAAGAVKWKNDIVESYIADMANFVITSATKSKTSSEPKKDNSAAAAVDADKSKKKNKNKVKNKKDDTPVVEISVATDEPEKKPEKKEPEVDDFINRSKKSELDDYIPGAHDQDFIFGHRAINPISDSAILYERFAYKKAYSSGEPNCDLLLELKSGKSIGVIPMLRLSKVWGMAQEYGKKKKLSENEKFGISYEEWKAALDKIEKHLKKASRANREDGKLFFVQDMMDISELTYESLFLHKADKVIAVVDAAIRADISESEDVKKKWKKIKQYKYKVALEETEGGIFSRYDAEILRKNGINYLNDIRKHNIYELKNMMLDYSFSNIVEDINAAYKEDLARRRDARYKVYPFIFGFVALAAMTVIGYIFQYTLIKNTQMTSYVNIASSVWVITLGTLFWAMVRAKKRRRRRPSYVFLTRKVKSTLRVFVIFALFSIGSLALFYQRYDGYNNVMYYRDLDDGTIAIAGLVDDEVTDLVIPETIDDKTVSEIDLHAFRKDDLESVELPATVKSIDTSAFSGCEKLTEITQVEGELEGVTSIAKKAFKDCLLLKSVGVIDTAKTVGKKAFEGCSKLVTAEFTQLEALGEAAFENCASLTTVELGNKITAIPDSAFKNCQRVETVGGFAYVTEVDDEAFYGCISLLQIDFSRITMIGKKSFYACDSFTEIVIPGSVQEIGKDAFSACLNVHKITVPFVGKNRETSEKYSLDYYIDCSENAASLSVTLTDMTTIPSKMFNDCVSVKEVVLPDGLEIIEAGAFKGSGIKSFYIPAGVTVIEEGTFEECTYLETVTGGSGVQTIEENAFAHCLVLESINFEKVASIGDGAFRGCTELSSIGAMANLREVGEAVFENCGSLNSVDISTAPATVLGADMFKNCTQLSYAKLPASLTAIPDGMFDGCISLESFELTDDIRAIGDDAFRGSGLVSVDLGKVVTIGKSAFKDCSRLTSLEIPNNVTTVGKSAFADCAELTDVKAPFLGESRTKTSGGFKHMFGSNSVISSISVGTLDKVTSSTFKGGKERLRSITLGDGVKQIGANAFKNFKMLHDINFPDSLTKIGKNAFKNCVNITVIDLIDSKVTSIGSGAFDSCRSLNIITLPGELEKIPSGFVRDCENLDSVTISNGTKSIGNYAFRGCTSLTSINIPDSILKLGKATFRGCTNLTNLTISKSLEEIPENTFRDCRSLDEITISGIDKIGDKAFYNCSSLMSVTIGSGVRRIGEKAFYNCSSLIDLSISSSVQRIDKRAFGKCTSLYEVVVPSSVTKMESYIFSGCSSLRKLTIPFLGSSVNWAKRLSYVTNSRVIEDITITDAKKIKRGAFRYKTSLEIIELNAGITKIGKNVVNGCRNLEYVVLPTKSMQNEFGELFDKYYIEVVSERPGYYY